LMEVVISTNINHDRDEIFIKDLMVRGIIGITESERAQPQDILVNITLRTNAANAARSDDVDDSVNYRTVAKMIIAHIEKVHRHTVEALANDIANLCLEDPKVQHVIVQVEKPGAVRFSRSVGIRIERTRD
jgi:FolB domain-containing protein